MCKNVGRTPKGDEVGGGVRLGGVRNRFRDPWRGGSASIANITGVSWGWFMTTKNVT